QYSDFEKLNLKREQLKIISSLLSGFPEQVFYVAELIKDMGIKKTLDNSYLIREYNFDKVIPILDKYKQNKETMEFLQLLASFDFIGYDLIFEIAEEDFYKDLLQEFIARAICEHLGATKEYIRLNDAIRDYVRRANKEIPTQFEDKLKQHYIKFLKNYKTEEIDVADLFYSMKQALLSGEDIDPSYLIPSHFLKTMKELYDEKKNYEDIVKLADRVLQNEKNMDEFIVFQIRYYLCQSLAKLKDTRFTKEVQKIKGSEHNFLLGFYYRQLGNNIKAIERQKMALKERKYFPRAQRELVQLYLNLEDFDKALDLAKTNYCNSKNNPYHIQAYFRCLINSEKNSENSKIIKELLPNLDKIKTDKGKEMFLQAKAQYYAFFKNDKLKAYQYVEQAIYDFPNVHYTYLTKFDICERFDDILGMKDAIKYLEGKVRRQNFLYNTLLGRKAIYYSKTKDIKKARDLLKEIKNYPENALERLHTKIETIYKTNS
ncbi:MAG: hypothetical protein H8E11_03655, partial [Candidatus Cloacimonetes bacterium]|nr:hypothetical protein [Candidatus Cloacimonadota bacterium]